MVGRIRIFRKIAAMNAAQLFVKCLECEAAPFVFGLPGEENLVCPL